MVEELLPNHLKQLRPAVAYLRSKFAKYPWFVDIGLDGQGFVLTTNRRFSAVEVSKFGEEVVKHMPSGWKLDFAEPEPRRNRKPSATNFLVYAVVKAPRYSNHNNYWSSPEDAIELILQDAPVKNLADLETETLIRYGIRSKGFQNAIQRMVDEGTVSIVKNVIRYRR